jgi:peptidoglycan/LPS O-acetylase OafA/YrhL
MPSDTKPNPRLDSIESLRGLAALLIIFYHLAELAQLPLPQCLGFVRSHFGLGVPLFYTLSGFVLSWGYALRLTLGQGEIIPFYVRRFFRIAPLFYAVLLGWRGLGALVWSWSDSGLSLLLNLTFLFGLVPGQHESLVMAGWSIGVEMIFYFIFPVLIVVLRNVIFSLLGLAIFCILSGACWESLNTAGLGSYAYMNLITQMPFFVAGISCFRFWQYRNFKQGRRGYLIFLIAILIIVLMSKDYRFIKALNNLHIGAMHRNIWSIIFGLIVYSSCMIAPSWLNKGPLFWIGRMSFSMYLLHPLVMVALIKFGTITWLGSFGTWPAFLLGSALTLTLVCTVGYVSYRWIEIPGIMFGKHIQARWSPNAYSLPPKNVINATMNKGKSPDCARNKNKYLVWLDRLINSSIWTKILLLIALGAFLCSTYITIRYIHQPLADIHAFRQTQTALTAFWILKEGWALSYQTPVAGFPWSIPFEFPIYQTIVAALAAISNFDLEVIGRFVSYVFLVACAWPAFLLNKRLALPRSVPWVFCALLWSSPLNLYWGRTFMIETTALFFSLACLPYALDVIRRVGGHRSALWFVIFATAAVLQKSTTGGPVLLFLFILALITHLRQTGFNLQAVRYLLYPLIVIFIPLIIGLTWAHYADIVKMSNPFGSQLTSTTLGQWNFGTLQQKLNLETWRLVVWERSLRWNAGGFLGVLLLILPWLGGQAYRRYAWLSLAALMLFLLPVLIFTNVHFVHEYYQVACVPFLLGALAIVIGGWLHQSTSRRLIVPVVTMAIVLSNLVIFNKSYGIVTRRSLDELDPRSVQSYKVGRYLREVTRQGSGLVVFGNGYSSEIAFQAQRKTMAAPPWFKNYADLWAHPQNYLGNTELAALVICPESTSFPTIKGFPDLDNVDQRLKLEPEWIHRSVHGCELLLSPNTLVLEKHDE